VRMVRRWQASVYEGLISAVAVATHGACLRHADLAHTPQVASARAGTRPRQCLGCDDRPASSPEIFAVLADTADDPASSELLLRLVPGLVSDLALTAGPAADGIIVDSSRRLLAYLRAGDAEAAEREVERQLRCLYFMCRLVRGERQALLWQDGLPILPGTPAKRSS
jgi:hypothetical protein